MKRRYEFRARLWQSLATIAICATLTLGTVGCTEVFHQPKHTGPVTVAKVEGEAFILQRSNLEIFVMHFHGDHPQFWPTLKLADVLYEDEDRDQQYFVKAVLAQGETMVTQFTQEKVIDCSNGCQLTGIYGPNTAARHSLISLLSVGSPHVTMPFAGKGPASPPDASYPAATQKLCWLSG